MEELNIHVPFVFSSKIDPRSVFTVGDQIVSEHVFAFHYSASIKKSTVPLFSNVIINEEQNLIEIELLKEVIDSSGRKYSSTEICDSIKSSFSGTQHTRYSSLLQSIECKNKKVLIKMSSIPVNIEYWLRSTDFAIINSKYLPLENTALHPTTGPYFIKSMTSSVVELKKNKSFPADFVSNQIENVKLISYSPTDMDYLVDKERLHLAYLYGYSINENLISKIKNKNFKVQVFPNEWLMYLGFQKSVGLNDRKIIASRIDTIRPEFQEKITYGNIAYSTIPGDRAYGLDVQTYNQYAPTSTKDERIKRKLVFSTLDEWAQIPLFSFIIKELLKDPHLEVKIFSRKDMAKIYSSAESDFYLSPMGISAADPLGNYSFFFMYDEIFKNILSEPLLVSLYKEKDFSKFSQRIREIEIQFLKERILVPIGHFPGIVIESPDVMRDENKSWDWGIQAWTYKTI